jgi:hypothetical protein
VAARMHWECDRLELDGQQSLDTSVTRPDVQMPCIVTMYI